MAELGTRLQRFPGNYQQARAIFYGMGQHAERARAQYPYY